MQYRSGYNTHEPLNPDQCSRMWTFVLRGDYEYDAPLAFLPHCQEVAWIFTPYPHVPKWGFLRGYVRFATPRNYYTMKSRYSHTAEWIPLALSSTYYQSEFTTRPIKQGSSRYRHYNNAPVNLHKVGYNVQVPDLIEEYVNVMLFDRIEQQRYEADLLKGYEFYSIPPDYVPPPSRLPQPPLNEEYWYDMPDGSRYFMARFVNGELLFTPP